MQRLTNSQKTAIQEFRAAGLGYKAIGKRLSLSRETVRSFCVRNGISAMPDSEEMSRDAVSETDQKRDNTSEIQSGNTVFIITTGYSESASETLEKKLKKLILDAVVKQSRSYQFVQVN